MADLRKLRRYVAGALILLLLSYQAATAAYVCAQELAAGGYAMADMPGCEHATHPADMDSTQPLLCKASCEHQITASNPAPTLDLGLALPVLYFVVAALPAAAVSRTPHAVISHLGESPPGWPPLYLLNSTLLN